MTEYDVLQITQGVFFDDYYFPVNRLPSISGDGRKVVFASKQIDTPHIVGYYLHLYDRDSDELQRLSTRVDGGDERYFSPRNPQISADGEKIVFDSLNDYIGDGSVPALSGIYSYDISSNTVRRVVTNMIPPAPTGWEDPTREKRISVKPSISSNGSSMSYVHNYYIGTWHPRRPPIWRMMHQRLMIAEIGRDTIQGGTILSVSEPLAAYGRCIHSQSISEDGRVIAFYAGGEIDGLRVGNLEEMPPYEEVTHHEGGYPTCDVYCYVVTIREPGRYLLKAVPDPDSPTDPLIVAHPYTHSIQSYRINNVLGHPPSISADGRKIALTGGFVMGESRTGVYLYDTREDTTTLIQSFGSPAGAGGDESLSTGALPSISGNGEQLTYYFREVFFPEGYGDPSAYEEGHTYCPYVLKDEVMVHDLASGERIPLIESTRNPAHPFTTPEMGIDIDRDGRQITFISTANKVDKNADHSHEVYLAHALD